MRNATRSRCLPTPRGSFNFLRSRPFTVPRITQIIGLTMFPRPVPPPRPTISVPLPADEKRVHRRISTRNHKADATSVMHGCTPTRRLILPFIGLRFEQRTEKGDKPEDISPKLMSPPRFCCHDSLFHPVRGFSRGNHSILIPSPRPSTSPGSVFPPPPPVQAESTRNAQTEGTYITKAKKKPWKKKGGTWIEM